MKRIIKWIIILAILVLALAFPTTVNAKGNNVTNLQIVKKLCKKTGKDKIRFIQGYNNKVRNTIYKRKNKNYVVVEKVVTISNGKKGGYDKDGYYVAYNKKVARGKKVISYVIYNPKTNYCDDILFVVDNKCFR